MSLFHGRYWTVSNKDLYELKNTKQEDSCLMLFIYYYLGLPAGKALCSSHTTEEDSKRAAAPMEHTHSSGTYSTGT
jgi:hypothetical protein